MLNVTLVTADSLAGTLFINTLVRGAVNIEKVLVVSSLRGSARECVTQGWHLFRRRSSSFLFYRYVVEDVLFRLFCEVDKSVHSIERVSREHCIPLRRIIDVNSPECLSEFEGYRDKTKLVISAYGSQIFGNELIDKIDNFWNVHGSYLPYFRGAAPYFWMLMVEEYPRGVTLHRVLPELDQGPIIKQMIVNPEANDTLFFYHARCVLAAAGMIADVMKGIDDFGAVVAESQARASLTNKRRFGIPASKDMQAFKNAEKRLFAWRDLRKVARLLESQAP